MHLRLKTSFFYALHFSMAENPENIFTCQIVGVFTTENKGAQFIVSRNQKHSECFYSDYFTTAGPNPKCVKCTADQWLVASSPFYLGRILTDSIKKNVGI